MRRIPPIVALFLVTTAPSEALASPELRWSAPPGCPRSEEVQSRVEQLLGGPLEGRGIRADATVEGDGDGWSLDLELHHAGVDERRSLSATKCTALADALALLLAVLTDPVATSLTLAVGELVGVDPSAPAGGGVRVVPPEPAPKVLPEPASGATPPLEATPPEPTPLQETSPEVRSIAPEDLELDAVATGSVEPLERRNPLVWSLRIAGGAEIGALPGPSGGVSAAFTLRRRRFQAELSGLYVFPRSRPIDEVEGATIWSQLGVAGLRGCALPPVGQLALPLCVGLEAGALVGEGRGLDGAERPRSPWLAVVVGPSLRWPFAPRAALWAGAELALPLLAPRFVIEVPSAEMNIAVHQPSPVTARLLVGFEFTLAGVARENSASGDEFARVRR